MRDMGWGLLLLASGLLTGSRAMEAMGRLSTAQCTLEMSQLDKREGVKRLCKSVSQLYSQLQETQRDEKRYVGKKERSQAGMDHQVHAVMLKNQHLERKLAFSQKAFAQNEKLELGLEELQELYGRSQAEKTSEKEAAELYEKRYEEAERSLDGAGKLLKKYSQHDSEQRQVEEELQKGLSSEHRKLVVLQKKASADTFAMKKEVGALRKEVGDSRHLRQSLVLAQRTDHEESDRMKAANEELTTLRAEMLKMKSMLVEATTTSSNAEVQVSELLHELSESKASLHKASTRVATLEGEAKSLQQKADLSCEHRVQQAYDECASKV